MSGCHYELGRGETSYVLALALIRLDDKDPEAYMAVASSANMTGRHRKAIEAAQQGVALEPKRVEINAELHYQSAEAYGSLRQYGQAIKEYDRAFEIYPKLIRVLTNEAYLLATCPDEKHRDGPKARKLAAKACEATDYKGDEPLKALAAAEAECGNFAAAVRFQKQALSLLDASLVGTKEEYEKILDLYEKGRPYRSEFTPKEKNNGTGKGDRPD